MDSSKTMELAGAVTRLADEVRVLRQQCVAQQVAIDALSKLLRSVAYSGTPIPVVPESPRG